MMRLRGILCVAVAVMGIVYAAVHWPVIFFVACVAIAYAAARRVWSPVVVLSGAALALVIVLGAVLLSPERRERLRQLAGCEKVTPVMRGCSCGE